MRSYHKVFLLLAFLTIPLVAAMSGLRGQSQGVMTSNKTKEEATPIQEGVMTEKQKKHSKLFKGTHYRGGQKVADLVAKKGDVKLWGPIREVPLYKMPLSESLANLKCNTDIVIIGSVKSKSSNLIETGTFVFTDYEITVEEILKNSDQATIQPGQDITVPRLGGDIILNGHTVRAVDEAVFLLEKGERYLFYLKYEPLAATYRPFGHPLFDDTFRLSGDKISQVSRKPLPLGWKQTIDLTVFMNESRQALNRPCQVRGVQ